MNYFELKPKTGYGFIYKYRSPNQKEYIGQTCRTLKERAGVQGQYYKGSLIFFSAIKKYGFENFSVEIICEAPLELLDELEEFYIAHYNTIYPNGYNIQKGGKSKYTLRKNRQRNVIKYDTQGNFIQSFNSVKDAAKEMNCNYQTISSVLSRKRRHYKGYIYRYSNEKAPEPIVIMQTHGKTIAQYTLEGEFIAIFKSANEAARAIGKNSNAGRNIRNVSCGKRQSAYGFKWKNIE